ncbi:hypothetical protein O1611_g519 [Lasiodiplodia mahajangana]|uniref:Uncharacterized protein n=1 Tax=Lasiodiplodia mahajangana TaxID=1108764 RepID=A0ACC2K053_9PEZI|nr:hypothetical protein O1611_g519 [Lasiodiplodia mahajangana]
MSATQTQSIRLETCEEENHRTWILSESNKILAAVQEAQRLSKKRKRGNMCKRNNKDKIAKLMVQDAAVHPDVDATHNDALLRFTTLLDPEEHVTSCGFSASHEHSQEFPKVQGAEKERHTNVSSMSNTSSTHVKIAPAPQPQEPPKQPEPSHTEEEIRENSSKVDNLRHLIDPAILAFEHAAAVQRGSVPASPNSDGSQLYLQRAAVAELVAQDRQFDAFKKALTFAYRNVSELPGVLHFTVRYGRYTYHPGVTYPVVLFILEGGWPDANMRSRLAYYLLGGMLECYGNLPFPDRVDVRELGFGCSSLVAQYGFDSDLRIGYGACETGRVRKRIIEDMCLREV